MPQRLVKYASEGNYVAFEKRFLAKMQEKHNKNKEDVKQQVHSELVNGEEETD